MKIGTVEPKYTDLHKMNGVIENDQLAFIHGAISKYGTNIEIRSDEEYLNSLKEYIIKIAQNI